MIVACVGLAVAVVVVVVAVAVAVSVRFSCNAKMCEITCFVIPHVLCMSICQVRWEKGQNAACPSFSITFRCFH